MLTWSPDMQAFCPICAIEKVSPLFFVLFLYGIVVSALIRAAAMRFCAFMLKGPASGTGMLCPVQTHHLGCVSTLPADHFPFVAPDMPCQPVCLVGAGLVLFPDPREVVR